MPSYVAFLRAVNVGGRFVKMAELRTELEGAGFTDVETHIQSGNVLVRSGRRSTGAVATEMARVLGEWAGFDVPCLVRCSRAGGATWPSPTVPCRRRRPPSSTRGTPRGSAASCSARRSSPR